MKSIELLELLNDGFAEKIAKDYLNIREYELNNSIFSKEFVDWAYSNGFSAEGASVLGINENNKNNYLSSYDYCKVWPLNNWTRIWINDKLTLKYTLSNSALDIYMPKYYYYTAPNGLRALMDNDNKDNTTDGFIKTLKTVGTFAGKICNGAASAGFFVLKFKNDSFFINDALVSAKEMEGFIDTHPNYVFTEYLQPCDELKKFGDLIHTIRIIVLNEKGNNPRIIAGYIRFPNDESGVANYIAHDGTNNEKFNIYTSYDAETGEYNQAVAAYPNRIEPLITHPDTGAVLQGILPQHEELLQAAMDISKWFNTIEFMGFDFCISQTGIKLMEINTHPGSYTPQIFSPFFKQEQVKAYFEKKIKIIDNYNDDAKKSRNNIMR